MNPFPIRPAFARPGRALAAVLVLCAGPVLLTQPSLAQTLPGIPGAGGITVSTGGSQPVITAPNGNTLDIDLNAPRTVINWASLHVSGADRMDFHFDAGSDIVLNKTTTQIAIDAGGAVTGKVGAANGGNVWFFSPQGVIVSPGAVMTAGGFLFSRGASLTDATFVDASDVLASLRAAADSLIQITTITAATNVSITASGDVVLSAATGNLNAAIVAAAGTATVTTTAGSLTVTELRASGGAAQATAGGPGATVTTVVGDTGVSVSSASNSSVNSATTTTSGDIVIQSNGSASLTVADSARDVTLSAPAVFVSTVDAVRDIFITGTTGGATVTNRMFAGDDIEVTATTGAVAAGGATLRSTGLGASDDGHILVRSTGSSVTVNAAATLGTGVQAGDVIISAATSANLNTGNSSRDLLVSGVAATLGTGSAARDLFVSATTGDATVSTSATAGDDVEVTATTGDVSAGTLRATGVGASNDAHVFARSSSGAISVGTARTEGTGVATGDITVSGATTAALGLATSNGGDIAVTGGSSVTLSGVLSGGAVTLTSSGGAISQSGGSITAATLAASGASGVTLGQANAVTTLNTVNSGTGGFTYRDTDGFDLAGNVTSTGQTISLTSDTGAITQSGGSLLAATLIASAETGVTLTRAGNDVDSLGAMTNGASGGIAYRDTDGLALTGAVTAAGQTVGLTVGGVLSQSGGIVTATTLTGSSVGGGSFGRDNQIAQLGAFADTGGGALLVNSVQALTVTGAVASAGAITVKSHGGMTLGAAGSVTSSAAGDAIVLASDGVFTNQAGAAAVDASNAAGRWLIYSQAAGAPTGSTAGNSFGGLAGKSYYGVSYTFATGAFGAAPNPGDRFVYAYQPVLTATPVSQTVSYGDAAGPASGTVTGLVNGDLAADAWSGTVSVTGVVGDAVGSYVLTAVTSGLASEFNYAFQIATGTVQVVPRGLVGTIVALNKTYDGTTSATGSLTLNGVLAGDQVSASGTFAFADKNAGTGKTVTAANLSLTGASAGNYTLGAATGSADILKKTLTGATAASGKTYDGTTATTGSISLTGVLAGDQVSASATFAFADKNAGTGKTVTASGATLSGVDGRNYTVGALSTASADILRKALTGKVVAEGKTYDGGVTATGSIGLTGVLAGDQVSGSGTLVFADKNAGTGKTVTASNLALTGASAGNYDLISAGSGLADIARRSVGVTADTVLKYAGQLDPLLTYTVTSGKVVEGDSFQGALSRDAGETLGDYAIRRGSLALSSNYDLAFTGAVFTIRAPPGGGQDGAAALKRLMQSADFDLNWDPEAELSTGGTLVCSEGGDCQTQAATPDAVG